jgi:hypothetical protein
MAREKILVADQDLDSLSRIYLALIHRGFKAEACNLADEIPERLKRFKPAVVILNVKEYETLKEKLKIFAIVLLEKENGNPVRLNDGDIPLQKPVHADALIKAVETLI